MAFIWVISYEIILPTQLQISKNVHQKAQKFLEEAKNLKFASFSKIF